MLLLLFLPLSLRGYAVTVIVVAHSLYWIRTYSLCPYVLIKFSILLDSLVSVVSPLIHTLKTDFGSKYEHKYRDIWARKCYKGISPWKDEIICILLSKIWLILKLFAIETHKKHENILYYNNKLIAWQNKVLQWVSHKASIKISITIIHYYKN